ncbi:MAG: hypothetical protein DHS20C11_21840 [Lysobacteraceae bacterium]|nr:MAG: hypothetical protein DHS20C11_21840 [Xanthomonadaceae bacterium]
MIRMIVAVMAIGALSSCAHNPQELANRTDYCKPGSAIRYEGVVPRTAKNVRPAPKQGSCAEQI